MTLIEHEVPVSVPTTFPSEWIPQDPEPAPEVPEQTEAQRIAELLRKSADLLKEHGWTSGEPQDAKGRLCMLGAISMAVTGHARYRYWHEPNDPHRDYYSAVEAVAKILPDTGSDTGNQYIVYRWNDSHIMMPRFLSRRIVQRKLREVASNLENRKDS